MLLSRKWKFLFLLFTAISILTQAQELNSPLSRKYKTGDAYRYRMTTEVTHNGKWQSTIIAVCELKVATENNIPYDEVKWVSKKVITAKDTTDFPKEIQNTAPYRISLHPKGKLDIPPIDEPGMVGEITDFNTFFVAISPKMGIDSLHIPGYIFRKPESLQGNFANGKDILKGDDCLQVSSHYAGKEKNDVSIITDFIPPSTPCLRFLSPEMAAPVSGDSLNNFQMVRAGAGGKVNLFSGREKFRINSVVESKEGKLVRASMINQLTLKLKLNCDADYTNCQHTMPYNIERKITLELLR